jgi:hypothetical protein
MTAAQDKANENSLELERLLQEKQELLDAIFVAAKNAGLRDDEAVPEFIA